MDILYLEIRVEFQEVPEEEGGHAKVELSDRKVEAMHSRLGLYSADDVVCIFVQIFEDGRYASNVMKVLQGLNMAHKVIYFLLTRLAEWLCELVSVSRCSHIGLLL